MDADQPGGTLLRPASSPTRHDGHLGQLLHESEAEVAIQVAELPSQAVGVRVAVWHANEGDDLAETVVLLFGGVLLMKAERCQCLVRAVFFL